MQTLFSMEDRVMRMRGLYANVDLLLRFSPFRTRNRRDNRT